MRWTRLPVPLLSCENKIENSSIGQQWESPKHVSPPSYQEMNLSMTTIWHTCLLVLFITNASCVSNSKSEFLTHQRAGIRVENVLKIEGVERERGVIYKFDERFPWMELKYYCVNKNVTLNFTLEAGLNLDQGWSKDVRKDADFWCQFNSNYEILRMSHEIMINGALCPVYECAWDDEPAATFYSTSVPIPSLQARLIVAVCTTDNSLTPTSKIMTADEISLAIMELTACNEWKRKVRRS
jgi:hypothetical protein